MSTNCIGYDGTAKTSSKIYIGVNGIARQCAVGYVGVNGIARQIFPVITIPTVSGAESYEYDGTKKTVTISNVDSDYVNVSGITQATNVGNYTITVSLKDSYATWTDGTKAPKTYSWGITAKRLSIPTVSGNYYYNGNVRSAVISSYDTNLIAQSGMTQSTLVGTFTITFALKDPTNYCWSDGTTEDKNANWKIMKTSVSVSISGSYTCWYQRSGSTSTPHFAYVTFSATNAAGEPIKLYYDGHCTSREGWKVNETETGFEIIRDYGQPNGSETFNVGLSSNSNHSGSSTTITVTYEGTRI